MRITKHLFIILGIIFTILSCANDDNATDNQSVENLDASKFYEELNIAYGNDEDQKMAIYLPANRTLATKIIILVHGGGWTSGDKDDVVGFVNLIQQDFDNLAIVNMNYRLASDGVSPFPMQIEDITSVVDFLKENQNFYTISDELGFVGTSAGAHLAMLWSYAFDENSKAKMVCSIVGPTNFLDPAYVDNSDNPVLQEFLATFPNQTPEFLESVSPINQVTENSPPTILFYGDEDPLIPTSQGVAMKAKLDALNVINEFTLYQGEGHGWVGVNALDTWLKLSAFIQTNLVN